MHANNVKPLQCVANICSSILASSIHPDGFMASTQLQSILTFYVVPMYNVLCFVCLFAAGQCNLPLMFIYLQMIMRMKLKHLKSIMLL